MYCDFRSSDGWSPGPHGVLTHWQSGSGGGGAVIVTPIEEELGEHANCTIMGNSVDVDPSCIDRRIGRPPYVFITYPLCVFAISPANFMKDTLACPPILPAVSSARLIVTMSTQIDQQSQSRFQHLQPGMQLSVQQSARLPNPFWEAAQSSTKEDFYMYSRGAQSMTE